MRYRHTTLGNRLPLAALLSFCFSVGVAADELRFTEPEASSVTSDDGTIQLAWEWIPEPSEKLVYEVVRRGPTDMSKSIVVYQGKDSATFLSGLAEGEYIFRVVSRPELGGYELSSEQVTLNVEYIDRRLVVILMSAGFITFVAIVSAITIGHFKTKEES